MMKRGDMVVLSKKATRAGVNGKKLKMGMVLCIWEDLTAQDVHSTYSGFWVKVWWNGGHIYKHPRWYVKGVKNESR